MGEIHHEDRDESGPCSLTVKTSSCAGFGLIKPDSTLDMNCRLLLTSDTRNGQTVSDCDAEEFRAKETDQMSADSLNAMGS